MRRHGHVTHRVRSALTRSFANVLTRIKTTGRILASSMRTAKTRVSLVGRLTHAKLIRTQQSIITLHPRLLRRNDLRDTLRHLITRAETTTVSAALRCRVRNAICTLPARIRGGLLQVKRRTLAGTVGRTGTSRVQIRLTCSLSRIYLHIESGKRNFKINDVPTSRNFNLLNVDRQTRHVKTRLAVEDRPKRKARVVIAIGP